MFGFRGFNDNFFGGDDVFRPFPVDVLTDGRNDQGQNSRQNHYNYSMSSYNPFNMFHQMQTMMNQMTSPFETNMMNSPNCHVQSYSYSCTDNGSGPVVVEKKYSHQRMGDVSQTEAFIKDGRNREERGRIQHRLGDQARTITKTRVHGGDITTDEIYEHIDENEIGDFDRNWRLKAQRQMYLAPGQPTPNYSRGLPAPQISSNGPGDMRYERTPPKNRNPIRNSSQGQRSIPSNHKTPSQRGRSSNKGTRGTDSKM